MGGISVEKLGGLDVEKVYLAGFGRHCDSGTIGTLIKKFSALGKDNKT